MPEDLLQISQVSLYAHIISPTQTLSSFFRASNKHMLEVHGKEAMEKAGVVLYPTVSSTSSQMKTKTASAVKRRATAPARARDHDARAIPPAVDSSKQTIPHQQGASQQRICAIRSNTGAPSTPFHLVRLAVPLSEEAKTFAGQFLGKPRSAAPFRGPYYLAWTDPQDGLEVQMNAEGEAEARGLEPLLAEWTAEEVLSWDVKLTSNFGLDNRAIPLIQSALQTRK
jgi:hypothetical protein